MSAAAEEKSDDTMLMQCCACCGTAGGDNIKLMICSGCYLVRYCGVQCQKEHWLKHKKECKKRAAELRDEILFKLLGRSSDASDDGIMREGQQQRLRSPSLKVKMNQNRDITGEEDKKMMMLLRSLNVLKEQLEELEKLSMGEEDIQDKSTGEKDNQVEKATSEEDLPTETKIEQLKTDLKAKMTLLEIKYEGVDLDSCIGCEKARRHIQQKILKKSLEVDDL